MKRIILILLIAGLAGLLFAGDFTVQSVNGRVEMEVSPGKWEAVTTGAVLSGATVINTGLNSSLTLKDGERTVTVRAMQKGTIETLAGTSGGSGIRISGRIAETGVSASGRNTGGILTASTRASDAADDVEWVEE